MSEVYGASSLVVLVLFIIHLQFFALILPVWVVIMISAALPTTEFVVLMEVLVLMFSIIAECR